MLSAKKEAKLEFPGEGGGKQEPGECGHFSGTANNIIASCRNKLPHVPVLTFNILTKFTGGQVQKTGLNYQLYQSFKYLFSPNIYMHICNSCFFHGTSWLKSFKH